MEKLLNQARKLTKNTLTIGDTIVEVMVVTAILGLVVAGSYTLTNHSLQNGIDSNLRTEAVTYAQRQIEYIRDAYIHPSLDPALDRYENPLFPTFCIVSPTDPVKDASSDTFCTNYNQSGISISDSFDDTSKTFTVTALWDIGSGKQVNLYYKTPPPSWAG